MTCRLLALSAAAAPDPLLACCCPTAQLITRTEAGERRREEKHAMRMWMRSDFDGACQGRRKGRKEEGEAGGRQEGKGYDSDRWG